MAVKGFPRTEYCETCFAEFQQNTPTQLWCKECALERRREQQRNYERRNRVKRSKSRRRRPGDTVVRSVKITQSKCHSCASLTICMAILWTPLPLLCHPERGEETRRLVLERPEVVRAMRARVMW